MRSLPSGTLGECAHDIKHLRIGQKQSRYQILVTFLHELIHAIEDEYEVEIPHSLVDVLDCALAHFLVSNPEFVRMLADKLQGPR